MNKYISLTSLVLMFSCATSNQIVNTNLKDNMTFELLEISNDPTYGYSEKNPIQVGGVDKQTGPLNERRFLNALAGPNGEEVVYYRSGSCCPIKSKNDPFGLGQVMLDNYRVTWKGSKDTVSIYFNMYDYGSLKAPKGFTVNK
ncbi:2-dehydro-3-deoxyphosphooctonate aldolase [Flavobacterium difficile]|uniref:2-dehydro-3-deoxyphosphooctonate aldolase n=1 Tax=Flavobacterium difficile TaxID=2709659 RepID=A0ABX0I5Y1_9FLAO|nr:2-dehydro-3-deoxyphosphooctonate aldolase [Flavobacterium difficile]NHM02595.1 2-dehydro-3-deoxyphosphooctonate aldolase [Flavobacterium difficile]